MIYAEEAGWSHDLRYAFNDAITGYVEGYERLTRETKTVKKKRERSSRSTYNAEVPKNGTDVLFRYLGIDPDRVKEKQEAERVAKLTISDESWAAMEAEWEAEAAAVEQAGET